jgi:hypothetical protein
MICAPSMTMPAGRLGKSRRASRRALGSGGRSDKDQDHGGEDQDEGGAGKHECPTMPAEV